MSTALNLPLRLTRGRGTCQLLVHRTSGLTENDAENLTRDGVLG